MILTAGRPASSSKEPPDSAALEELTDREREVMALAAAGLSNEEIAERLVVSSATAKTHVSRALARRVMDRGPVPAAPAGIRPAG